MRIIKICVGCSCSRNFGYDNLKKAEKFLGLKAGEISADGTIKLEASGCLARCEDAPNVFFGEASPLSMSMNEGTVKPRLLPNKLEEELKKYLENN